MLVATPHYALDLARNLAHVEGKTLDTLDQEERDRYLELAAYVTDEYLAGDEFHEGCMPGEVAWDRAEEAWKDGYQAGNQEALDGIKTLADQSESDPFKANMRLAYKAARMIESGQALDHAAELYVLRAKEAERDG